MSESRSSCAAHVLSGTPPTFFHLLYCNFQTSSLAINGNSKLEVTKIFVPTLQKNLIVEEIYNQKIQSEELDFDGMFQAIGEIEVSRSVEQLNILYQKGFITKPFYEFPKNEQLGTEIVCWCFIDCIKNWEGYKSRGIGRGNSESEAKINAAYDILRFMLYAEENDTQEKILLPLLWSRTRI